MAKLYMNNNKIQKSWKRCRFIASLFLRLFYVNIGIIFTLLFFAFHSFNLIYFIVPLSLLLVIFYLGHLTASRQEAVLNAGVVGENATRQLIRHLPANFYAISNVKIEHEGNKSELDLVVVGHTGVFVIETKNYSGTILGRTDDNTWKRTKKSELGQNLTSSFYSPVKQVATHTYRLSKYLKQNKLFVWVQGAVYFSDSNATLKISGNLKKIPVFLADTKTPIKQNRLLKYIKGFSMRKKLSPKTIEKIVKLLRAAK